MTTPTTPANGSRTPRKAAAKAVAKSARAGVRSAPDKDAATLPSSLDLDALEREGNKDPFRFTHAGRQWTLNDPQDADWQQIMIAQGSPLLQLRLVLREDEKDAFFDAPMPAWKLKALLRAWREHYGITDEGELPGLSA